MSLMEMNGSGLRGTADLFGDLGATSALDAAAMRNSRDNIDTEAR
ncbi:hypothetical protein GCM10023088_51970 [Actinomadura verrucosospora]